MSETSAEVPATAALDPRPRQLLEQYASLVGALLLEPAEGLLEFEVPAAERKHWGRESVIRAALLPEALDEDPRAELLAIGSPLFERLIGAVRTRGFRETRGLVPPTQDPAPASAALPVEPDGAVAGVASAELSLLPVGRLLARVSIKSGGRLEERLVWSPPVDLSTGRVVAAELVRALEGTGGAAGAGVPSDAKAVSSKPVDELLPLLFDELAGELAEDLRRIETEAALALRIEVDRLDRYYAAMLEDVEPGDEPDDARQAKRAIRAELERRKGEEEERHRVRLTVHPLQLSEWQVLAQRVTWPLQGAHGHPASISATRMLSGSTEWTVSCPGCGQTPARVRVCRAGHASCPECSDRCGVCGETACRTHGLSECPSGPHPVCGDHARTCGSCQAAHCSQHAGYCAAADHEVCQACAVPCAACGTALCRAHATRTGADSPRGARWLCGGCTVHCEGGTNEPVGVDEAVRCTACERHICEVHRVSCAVDGSPHCSRHLRRSDHSGRLVCEHHRASCADEAAAILASDEVWPCGTCGRQICANHGGICAADGARHCTSHLARLADRPGQLACEPHRTLCHVDGVAFSPTGTRPCPVCERRACEAHRAACPNCARQVCVSDLAEGRCVTCARLEDMADPPDDLIQAGVAANNGEPPATRRWRAARDATATVVELDLGWTRRLVFAVAHGEVKPGTVVQHSLLGSRRRR